MRTNLYAMFWLCRMALPHMRAGASIINASSVQASSPSPELLDYATTKAGIANFTRGLAVMVATRGNPGELRGARSDLDAADSRDHAGGEGRVLRRADPDGPCRSTGRGGHCLRLPGMPESSYVTGEVLAVTGGNPSLSDA